MNTITKIPPVELPSNFAVDVTPTSWQPSTPLTFDEWEAIGYTLQQIDASINFWLGDWLLYGEAKWGERYAQAIEVTGWRYDRLARAKWVAAKCPFWLRRQNLSWTCHLNVAHLSSTTEQAHWLDVAEEQGLSSAELKQAIKAASLLPPALTDSSNGYGPHADDSDDVPFSASGPGIYANAPEWVEEYEGRRMKRTIELESDEYEEQWIARSWHKDGWLSGAVCLTPGEAVESLLTLHFGVVVKEEELPY